MTTTTATSERTGLSRHYTGVTAEGISAIFDTTEASRASLIFELLRIVETRDAPSAVVSETITDLILCLGLAPGTARDSWLWGRISEQMWDFVKRYFAAAPFNRRTQPLSMEELPGVVRAMNRQPLDAASVERSKFVPVLMAKIILRKETITDPTPSVSYQYSKEGGPQWVGPAICRAVYRTAEIFGIPTLSTGYRAAIVRALVSRYDGTNRYVARFINSHRNTEVALAAVDLLAGSTLRSVDYPFIRSALYYCQSEDQIDTLCYIHLITPGYVTYFPREYRVSWDVVRAEHHRLITLRPAPQIVLE